MVMLKGACRACQAKLKIILTVRQADDTAVRDGPMGQLCRDVTVSTGTKH